MTWRSRLAPLGFSQQKQKNLGMTTSQQAGASKAQGLGSWAELFAGRLSCYKPNGRARGRIQSISNIYSINGRTARDEEDEMKIWR